MEDIALLLEFLDENIMKEVRAEQERNRRGAYTWEHACVMHRPGATILVKSREETDFTIRVVRSIERGHMLGLYDRGHWTMMASTSAVPRL